LKRGVKVVFSSGVGELANRGADAVVDEPCTGTHSTTNKTTPLGPEQAKAGAMPPKPPQITFLNKGEQFSGFPCTVRGKKYWWHPDGFIDCESHRRDVCLDLQSCDFSINAAKYVVGNGKDKTVKSTTESESKGTTSESKGLGYYNNEQALTPDGYFEEGDILFLKKKMIGKYKAIPVGHNNIVFIKKNDKRNYLTRLPKVRRMAQREFSNRRDSPVMVRLLEEIIAKQ